MARMKPASPETFDRKGRPALTPEARENELIALAMDRAEAQLRDGSASSQVITHFLKLGTAKYAYETQKLKNENALTEAKTEEIKSRKISAEMYEKALKAMREYAGYGEPEDYEY